MYKNLFGILTAATLSLTTNESFGLTHCLGCDCYGRNDCVQGIPIRCREDVPGTVVCRDFKVVDGDGKIVEYQMTLAPGETLDEVLTFLKQYDPGVTQEKLRVEQEDLFSCKSDNLSLLDKLFCIRDRISTIRVFYAPPR